MGRTTESLTKGLRWVVGLVALIIVIGVALFLLGWLIIHGLESESLTEFLAPLVAIALLTSWVWGKSPALKRRRAMKARKE